MRILIDTHVLLWAVGDSQRLSNHVVQLLSNFDNQVYFSVASIWEIVIKNTLAKESFQVDVEKLSNALEQMKFYSLPITLEHAKAVATLQPIHKDPFDRILLAQTIVENILFLTNDKTLEKYSPLVHLI